MTTATENTQTWWSKFAPWGTKTTAEPANNIPTGGASSTPEASREARPAQPASDLSTWEAISKIGWQALEMGRDGAIYVVGFTGKELAIYRTELNQVQRAYTNWQLDIDIEGPKLDSTLESTKNVLVKTWIAAVAITYVAHKLLGLAKGVPFVSPLATLAQKTGKAAAVVFSWEVWAALHAVGHERERLVDGGYVDRMERQDMVLRMEHAYRTWSVVAVVSEFVKGLCNEVRHDWDDLGHSDATPNLDKLSYLASWVDWTLDKLGAVQDNLGSNANVNANSTSSSSFSDLGGES